MLMSKEFFESFTSLISDSSKQAYLSLLSRRMQLGKAYFSFAFLALDAPLFFCAFLSIKS